MMKSAGEQLAGQASLHGLSSQYSHRASSAWSWAWVMIRGLFLFFSMTNLFSYVVDEKILYPVYHSDNELQLQAKIGLN
jgi:hypothetical protein